MNKIKYNAKYIIGFLTILCTTICFITGCFSNSKPQTISIPKQMVDTTINYSNFINNWNKQVLKQKYKYVNLNINFDKYTLNKNNMFSKLHTILTFTVDKQYIEQLVNSKNHNLYLPFIVWLQEKEKLNIFQIHGELNVSKLKKIISKTINDKWYSNNTIEKILQYNEFCYYFEKNKQIFYNKGYTKNIKSCQQVYKLLKQ